MVVKILLDIHQKPILQKLNIKAVGDKLSNYLSAISMISATYSKNLPMYPPPQKWKFLGFLQKWDTLVEKDGKSCESGEIDHSESISASFWGKDRKSCRMTKFGSFDPI